MESGLTQKTGGGPSSGRLLASWDSWVQTSFRCFLPLFSIRNSRVMVWVVYWVPKSTRSRGSLQVTGVSTPLPFTVTWMSFPSPTTMCTRSLTFITSSMVSVSATWTVSYGFRWLAFGEIVQREFFVFMKALMEASITELFVIFTCFVTGSRHFALPQSRTAGSTSTMGPMEFAMSVICCTAVWPRMRTLIGICSGPMTLEVTVSVTTCEDAGGTEPWDWSGSNSATAREASSWGMIWNLAGSAEALLRTSVWCDG
mmetsp:Transcript_43013/g.113941  ORF Transcript_43013/g.113941 Transcript_43013/m.113941 type:complete len:256 (+) Transcript_43013:784-1551(+)